MTEAHQCLADVLAKVSNPTPAQLLTIASVNATLAVAAEHRTANAIAALKLSSADFEAKNPSSSSTAASRGRIARRNALAALVTEGLGIA